MAGFGYSRESYEREALWFVGFPIERNKRVYNLSEPWGASQLETKTYKNDVTRQPHMKDRKQSPRTFRTA